VLGFGVCLWLEQKVGRASRTKGSVSDTQPKPSSFFGLVAIGRASIGHLIGTCSCRGNGGSRPISRCASFFLLSQYLAAEREKASFNLSFSPEGLDSSSNFLFQLRANPYSLGLLQSVYSCTPSTQAGGSGRLKYPS
jgi:hypothetical protein